MVVKHNIGLDPLSVLNFGKRFNDREPLADIDNIIELLSSASLGVNLLADPVEIRLLALDRPLLTVKGL